MSLFDTLLVVVAVLWKIVWAFVPGLLLTVVVGIPLGLWLTLVLERHATRNRRALRFKRSKS